MAKSNQLLVALFLSAISGSQALPQAATTAASGAEPATFTANPNVGPGGSNIVDSDHFRVYNADATAAKTALSMLEATYDCFVTKLKWRSTGLSYNLDNDNGPRYKLNAYTVSSLDGGAAGVMHSDGQLGFGYLDVLTEYLTSPAVTVHEFGHALHYHQKTWVNQENTGAWWETFANWVADTYGTSDLCAEARKANGVEATGTDIELNKVISDSYQVIVDGTAGSGNYYQAWPFFTYLTNNPDNFAGLGQDTLRQMMLQYKANSNETPLHVLARVSTNATICQIVGGYWAHMAYVDIGHAKANEVFLNQRSSLNYANLDEQSSGTYKVKSDRAPRYMGSNIIPLTTSGATTVEVKVSSQGQFVATLAVRDKTAGSVRYVTLANGSGSAAVTANEEISLVVANAPAESKFIRLRRFEKFSLKQCMHGMKTSSFRLLSNSHSSFCLTDHVGGGMQGNGICSLKRCSNATVMLKHRLFENWILWFFSYLVVPIIQANFYSTESEFGRDDIFYYRKPIWGKITKTAITYLKDQSYCLLDDASFRNIVSKRQFGFSKVRLRPKENGVRVLANLTAASKVPVHQSSLIDHSFRMQKEAQTHSESVKFRHFKSVNYVLRDLHSVLKGITMTYPEILGSSVFDYNDIYRRLCPFLISLKNEFTSMPCLYVVICDVFKAFDTIDQDKLLTVMREVILNDEYIVKLSSQVCCTKKSLWAQYSQILSDQNNSNVEKITASLPPHILHQVLINQEKSRMMRREQLDHCLSEHVKHNVLLLDENFYLQEVGIPQGSLLSSLLCSFYYGHLEKNVLIPFIEKTCMSAEVDLSKMCGNVCAAEGSSKDGILSSPSYMLLRFIDDFLFISTSKKQAASFFSRLQRGIREYNCKMNTDKFCMNFDVDDKSWLLSKRVYLSEDGTPFLPWSGLLINCHTLEIQADYTRYLKNHLRSTLTVCWKDKPGQHLEVKLCSYLRPKCHPIFYDSNINSAPIVRLNIYQVFLLCAMKFHCYICDLSKICKLHAEYHLEIIQRSFRYMHKLIRKRMHLIDIDSHFHPMLQLEREEVEWLGLNAYIRVLRRKQSRHKELLSFLRSKMAYCLVQSASSELKYAVDNSHSSLFWKIKY